MSKRRSVMTKRYPKYDCVQVLCLNGFSWDDATALRRISMTLHAWVELECGNAHNWEAWSIVRGRKEVNSAGYVQFVYDDDGKPFIERHNHRTSKATYEFIPDREKGALKRLKAIMVRYPEFEAYHQTDCRGAALSIVRKSDIPEGQTVDAYYTRGIVVCK